MKCKLESKMRIYEVLNSLEKGYTSGDFSSLFPMLADDCTMESQWVLEPNVGYEAVMSYFTGKGETLKRNQTFPSCEYVELDGIHIPSINAAVDTGASGKESAMVKLIYEDAKPCMLMTQNLNGETIQVLVDVNLDSEGLVKRIDLCMPELFNYKTIDIWVDVKAGNNWNDTDEDSIIRIPDIYYEELHAFFRCAGLEFDEYAEDYHDMSAWNRALECWNLFSQVDSFDAAFEQVANVTYEPWNVGNPEAAEILGRVGKTLWENRKVHAVMAKQLREWTEKYMDRFQYAIFYGW